jgi:transcriptional regulator with XRE-family HTH domain
LNPNFKVMNFSKNIKLLRNKHNKTQEEVAFALNIKRSTLSGYENEIAQPGVDVMIAFSDYYKISLDTLLRVDLTLLNGQQLYTLEHGIDIYTQGGQLRVLATTVDSDGNENIELIPIKAHAGYTAGYADPEFISSLPRFRLPFLDKNKKFRCFQVQGDSMLPIEEGSWIVCEFVQDWTEIKDSHACIVITLNDGIVFKLVQNCLKINETFILHSLNPIYRPYTVRASEVQEIWRFASYISSDMPAPQAGQGSIISAISKLREDVDKILGKS